MALLAATISLERLAPWPLKLAQVWGALGIGLGSDRLSLARSSSPVRLYNRFNN